jgi:hypothetical protein
LHCLVGDTEICYLSSFPLNSSPLSLFPSEYPDARNEEDMRLTGYFVRQSDDVTATTYVWSLATSTAMVTMKRTMETVCGTGNFLILHSHRLVHLPRYHRDLLGWLGSPSRRTLPFPEGRRSDSTCDTNSHLLGSEAHSQSSPRTRSVNVWCSIVRTMGMGAWLWAATVKCTSRSAGRKMVFRKRVPEDSELSRSRPATPREAITCIQSQTFQTPSRPMIYFRPTLHGMQAAKEVAMPPGASRKRGTGLSVPRPCLW